VKLLLAVATLSLALFALALRLPAGLQAASAPAAGAPLETVTVDASSSTVTHSAVTLQAGTQYTLVVSGTATQTLRPKDGSPTLTFQEDAAYCYAGPAVLCTDQSGAPGHPPPLLHIGTGDITNANFGGPIGSSPAQSIPYAASHSYTVQFTPSQTGHFSAFNPDRQPGVADPQYYSYAGSFTIAIYPPASGGCSQFNVTGTWGTAQIYNQAYYYYTTWKFNQTGTTVSGSATLSAADAAYAGYASNIGRIVKGSITGTHLDLVVQWTATSGAFLGEYTGTVASAGQGKGQVTDGKLFRPENPSSFYQWSGSGSAQCVSHACAIRASATSTSNGPLGHIAAGCSLWDGNWTVGNGTVNFGKLNLTVGKNGSVTGTYDYSDGGTITGNLDYQQRVFWGTFKDKHRSGYFQVSLQSDQVSFAGYFKNCHKWLPCTHYQWVGQHS
jgi:hypothetical protein